MGNEWEAGSLAGADHVGVDSKGMGEYEVPPSQNGGHTTPIMDGRDASSASVFPGYGRRVTVLCWIRGVEQLVARCAHNAQVAGSSPASATNLDA